MSRETRLKENKDSNKRKFSEESNFIISDVKLKMAVVQISVPEQQISQFLADLLNLEAIEVGFNCFLTHRPDLNKANEVFESEMRDFLRQHIFRRMPEKNLLRS